MELYSFDSEPLQTKAWGIYEVSDGLGTPGFRNENIQIPYQDGKRWIKKRYSDRVLTFLMWVRSVDPSTGAIPSGKTLNQVLSENIDRLSQLFGSPGQHILAKEMPDGTTREAAVEILRPVKFSRKTHGLTKFALEISMADPFFYGTELYSDQQLILLPTFAWVHTNPGTAPATKISLVLTGPLESPKLECLETGTWVQYQGNIALGETVTIDVSDFTCEKDGLNMISAVKHAGDANWLMLSAGDNHLILTSSVTGGSCQILYYPAYF